jgi:hypothetical protein
LPRASRVRQSSRSWQISSGAAGIHHQLGHPAHVGAAAFLQDVQIGVEDLQHPGGQVPALLAVVRLGRDVLPAHDEVGKADGDAAGPGQAHGAGVGQEAAGVAAGLHPNLDADLAGALVMSQPVGEGDDVAAAEGRGVLTVIWACLAQAGRQLADDADGVPEGLGCLTASALG